MPFSRSVPGSPLPAAYEDGRVIAAFTDEGPADEEIEAMNDLTDTYLRMNNLLLESDYYGRRNAGA